MTRPSGTIHHLDGEACDGCGQTTFAWLQPCLPCVKARAKVATVGRGRCTCPKHLKRPTDLKRIGSRSWIACNRCLGQIRQVS